MPDLTLRETFHPACLSDERPLVGMDLVRRALRDLNTLPAHGSLDCRARLVLRVPTTSHPQLADLLGLRSLYLIREDFQRTGAYKLVTIAWQAWLAWSRGARAFGIASTGNAATAAAVVVGLFNIMDPDRPATLIIFMSSGNVAKKANIGQYIGPWATFDDDHDTFDAAQITARAWATSDSAHSLLEPYDADEAIAANGTILVRALQGNPEIRALAAPVIVGGSGGGGLMAGVGVVARHHFRRATIVAVEPELRSSTTHALRAGVTGFVPMIAPTLAGGANVGQISERSLRHAARLFDAVATVSERALARTMGHLLMHEGVRVEGAGALPIAALIEHPDLFRGHHVVCVVSGRNVDDAHIDVALQRLTDRALEFAPARVLQFSRPRGVR